MTSCELMSPKMTSQQLRKIKKPMIEKRRRERINESLNQLKTLVLEAMNKDESQYNKMEKADILEMTVKHLKSLQTRLTKGLESSKPAAVNKYKTGYMQCAEEVNRYLQSLPNVHSGIQQHLNKHLDQCAKKFEQYNDISNRGNESSPQGHNNQMQTIFVAGNVSPKMQPSPQGFVPVLISPNGSVGPATSLPHHQNLHVQTSPTAGSVIPLYCTRSVPSPHSASSCSSSDSRNYFIYQQDLRNNCYSPAYSSSAPSSPLSATDAPTQCLHKKKAHMDSFTSQFNGVTRLPEGCQDFTHDLHKYNREQLVQSPNGSDVWRPW